MTTRREFLRATLRNTLTTWLVMNDAMLRSWATESDREPFASHLLAHWPLAHNGDDVAGHAHHATPFGNLRWNVAGPNDQEKAAVEFLGRDGYLEVPRSPLHDPLRQSFTLACWIALPDSHDDVTGDLASQLVAPNGSGFHWSIKTNSVTTNQANERQLQFGLSDAQAHEWKDCGRPGNALLGFSMASHDGTLYVGTCEPAASERGHVYRYAGDQNWIDCGSPDLSNSVTALASFDGQLFAATGKYRVAGSALPESPNTQLGGRIFRYEPPNHWHDCGQLPNTEAVAGLVSFRGHLYASSLYKPAGFYRYEGEKNWVDAGTPNGARRVEALAIFNGFLYASSYDGGNVYRYDGERWEDCGVLGDNTQTYAFAIYRGQLHVGTWPSGRVYRLESDARWTDVGRLGSELEVMGMLVHNGQLIAGTLPSAEVYAYQGGQTWQRLTQLDHTPDVKYRRAWTMAEHRGRVYCTTLPSGHVYSTQIGYLASSDFRMTPGWHHVAVTRSLDQLTLYCDGVALDQITTSPLTIDQPASMPFRIGFGPNDFFRGRMADLRLYDTALTADQLATLSNPSSAR